MTEMILLKLGELVLKGANRYTFEDKLKSNLARLTPTAPKTFLATS